MSMKDFCQKWKVKKLSFWGVWNSLMAWPDWPRPPPPYFTTDYATAQGQYFEKHSIHVCRLKKPVTAIAFYSHGRTEVIFEVVCGHIRYKLSIYKQLIKLVYFLFFDTSFMIWNLQSYITTSLNERMRHFRGRGGGRNIFWLLLRILGGQDPQPLRATPLDLVKREASGPIFWCISPRMLHATVWPTAIKFCSSERTLIRSHCRSLRIAVEHSSNRVMKIT